jgi:hypothetical protein
MESNQNMGYTFVTSACGILKDDDVTAKILTVSVSVSGLVRVPARVVESSFQNGIGNGNPIRLFQSTLTLVGLAPVDHHETIHILIVFDSVL